MPIHDKNLFSARIVILTLTLLSIFIVLVGLISSLYSRKINISTKSKATDTSVQNPETPKEEKAIIPQLTCEEKKKYNPQMDCDPKTAINESCSYGQIKYNSCLSPTDDTTCKGQENSISESSLLVGIPYWCGWNNTTKTTEWYIWNRYGECVDSTTCTSQKNGSPVQEQPKNRIILRPTLSFMRLPGHYKMYEISNYLVFGLSYQQYLDKNAQWPRVYQYNISNNSYDPTTNNDAGFPLDNVNLLLDRKYYESKVPIYLTFWSIAKPVIEVEEGMKNTTLACLKTPVVEISKPWGDYAESSLYEWDYTKGVKYIHFSDYVNYPQCSSLNKLDNYCIQTPPVWEDCSDSKFDDMRDIITDTQSQL